MRSKESYFQEKYSLQRELTDKWYNIHCFLQENAINKLRSAVRFLEMLDSFALWYEREWRKKEKTDNDANEYIAQELIIVSSYGNYRSENIAVIRFILEELKKVSDKSEKLGGDTTVLLEETDDFNNWDGCKARLQKMLNFLPEVIDKFHFPELQSIAKTYLRHQIIKQVMNPDQHSELLEDIDNLKFVETNYEARIRQLYRAYVKYAIYVDEEMINPFVSHIEKANISISGAFTYSNGLVDFMKNVFTNRNVQQRKNFRDALEKLKNKLCKVEQSSPDAKLLAMVTFKKKFDALIEEHSEMAKKNRRSLTLFAPRSELQGHLGDLEKLKPIKRQMLFGCDPDLKMMHQELKKKSGFSLSKMLLCA